MRKIGVVAVALMLAGGCASSKKGGVAGGPATRPVAVGEAAAPQTRPVGIAYLELEEILPRPVLPTTRATTRPAGPPSAEALQAYAKARAAQHEPRAGARYVVLLREAIAKDPASAWLQMALGQAVAGAGAGNDEAVKHFERAVELRPDFLEAQVMLGRIYLLRGNNDGAIEHLRLALQCSEAQRRPDLVGRAHLYLARALREKGYDTAALRQYELAGQVVDERGRRFDYELWLLAEDRHAPLGELYRKLGKHEKAIEAYSQAAEREPNNFEHQAAIVRTLLEAGRFDEARQRAGDLVVSQRAAGSSIDLLREVYKGKGEDEVVAELRRIAESRPGDRFIAFALADVMAAADRHEDAERILRRLIEEGGGDSIAVSRLFEFYVGRGESAKAGRLVIETLAKRPEAVEELAEQWGQLTRPTAKNRLRLNDVRGLEVSPSAEAAKLYVLSQLARLVQRDALARSSLEKAVTIDPPFAPAFRGLVDDIARRPDVSNEQKQALVEKLIGRATAAGRAELAEEVRGVHALRRNEPQAARAALEKAYALGSKTPAVQFALAQAMFAEGRSGGGEQMLWKLISDAPNFDGSYTTLIEMYLNRRTRDGFNQAERVLKAWRGNDPFNPSARVQQARFELIQGRGASAKSIIDALFRDEPDNPLVVEVMTVMYRGSADEMLKQFEEEVRRRPHNQTVLRELVSTYAADRRASDAMRVLDQARGALEGDAEQLYFVAHLYELIERKDVTEQVLAESIRIDPRFPPANNDLGYMWADEGKNLSQAEQYIRMALEAEPENHAYLDSLGWVLYKRSKFEEAWKYLNEAATVVDRPDPVVLDHLGDVLYRLGRAPEAKGAWQRSLERLADAERVGGEMAKLKLAVQQKLRQQEAKQPVKVAPTVDGPPAQATK